MKITSATAMAILAFGSTTIAAPVVLPTTTEQSQHLHRIHSRILPSNETVNGIITPPHDTGILRENRFLPQPSSSDVVSKEPTGILAENKFLPLLNNTGLSATEAKAVAKKYRTVDELNRDEGLFSRLCEEALNSRARDLGRLWGWTQHARHVEECRYRWVTGERWWHGGVQGIQKGTILPPHGPTWKVPFAKHQPPKLHEKRDKVWVESEYHFVNTCVDDQKPRSNSLWHDSGYESDLRILDMCKQWWRWGYRYPSNFQHKRSIPLLILDTPVKQVQNYEEKEVEFTEHLIQTVSRRCLNETFLNLTSPRQIEAAKTKCHAEVEREIEAWNFKWKQAPEPLRKTSPIVIANEFDKVKETMLSSSTSIRCNTDDTQANIAYGLLHTSIPNSLSGLNGTVDAKRMLDYFPFKALMVDLTQDLIMFANNETWTSMESRANTSECLDNQFTAQNSTK